MGFEVTSDTVVKILVRRGLNAERKITLLSEGELGYAVNTRRLFVGDGYTPGGLPVGTFNFGFASNRNDYNSVAEDGDLVRENHRNYIRTGNTWSFFDPTVYSEINNSNIKSIDYTASTGELRVDSSLAGTGFVLDYTVDNAGTLNNSIQKAYGKLNFDARYISLCASANSFYIGNVFNKTVSDNLGATLNVTNEIFINQQAPNPYQLKLYAKDPSGSNNSLIQAVSGNLDIKAKNSVNIFSGTGTSSSNSFVYSSLQVIGSVTQNVSDKRLKIVLGKVENSLDKIEKLNGIYFKYNNTANKLGIVDLEPSIGLEAQEVQSVLPEIVKPAPFDIDENGISKTGENYLTIQYDKLVPVLVEAIKELNSKVNLLKNKIDLKF